MVSEVFTLSPSQGEGRSEGAWVATLHPLPARERGESDTAYAWRLLDEVPDPELPALSVRDLGIVRDVVECEGGIDVVLTPTYSGCPATEVIEQDVRETLEAAGFDPVRVRTRLAPAWTTDWISDEGKRKLSDYGIAPPGPVDITAGAPLRFMPRIACPRCASAQTERLSAFGSTVCKALYRCVACREPFEHFKPI